MAEESALARSRAVLIGVSAYEYAEFLPIRPARNSLLAMRALLTDPTLCAWPPERIDVIANPTSAQDLALRLADLTESTTDVLLLYYVGHGALTDTGELCLTLTSTRPDRPKLTGLPWATVAEVLRDCPARTRIAILDCCFAGQAIETLNAGSGPGFADITHVEGAYTLTATTRNQTAHVPPPGQQDTACTSFTAELRAVVRAGIPGGPPRLTIADIYPQLRQRLASRGLPAPNQRGTDTAALFPFTVNVASVKESGERPGREGASPPQAALRVRLLGPASERTAGGPDAGITAAEVAQAEPAQAAEAGNRRAMLVVRDAERTARSITDKRSKALALTELAQAIAATDPDRATRLIDNAVRTAQPRRKYIHSSPEEDSERRFLAAMIPDIAEAAAIWNPDQAERIVESLGDGENKDKGLAVVAQAIAVSDPERAEHMAASITAKPSKALALARIARALAAVNPQAAARLVDEARLLTESISNSLSHSDRLWELDGPRAAIAEAVATIDPGRTGQALALVTAQSRNSTAARVALVFARSDPDRAEELARSISREHDKAIALADLSRALAGSDPGRARRLIHDAMQMADLFSGERWQFDQAAAHASIAAVLAEWDPQQAEAIARSISDEGWKATALATIARAVATSAPDHAEAIARSISDERRKTTALANIARAVATSAPDHAEHLARSISFPDLKVSALVGIARTWLEEPPMDNG